MSPRQAWARGQPAHWAGGEAEDAALAALGAVGDGADLVVGAGEGGAVAVEGEVVRAQAFAALGVIGQGSDELGAPARGLRHIGVDLACAGSPGRR